MTNKGKLTDVQKKVLNSLKSGAKIKYVRNGSKRSAMGKTDSYVLTSMAERID